MAQHVRFSFLLKAEQYAIVCIQWGFPGGASGKEPTCQCRRHRRCGFDPWVGKIPWSGAWQPILVFLPGESHGQRSLVGYRPQSRKELDMTEVTLYFRSQRRRDLPQSCSQRQSQDQNPDFLTPTLSAFCQATLSHERCLCRSSMVVSWDGCRRDLQLCTIK